MGIISSDKNKSFRHELVGFGSDTTVLDTQRVSAKTLVDSCSIKHGGRSNVGRIFYSGAMRVLNKGIASRSYELVK